MRWANYSRSSPLLIPQWAPRPDLNNRWLRVLARIIYSVVPRVSERMLQAATLATLERIRHAFFTRSGGVSEGGYASLNGGGGSRDTPDKVAENRARMAAVLGVTPDRLLTAYQIHSPTAVVADKPWNPQKRAPTDAIVTRVPRLAIGVSTADCGPLLFADGAAGVIGAAHAGWGGGGAGGTHTTR